MSKSVGSPSLTQKTDPEITSEFTIKNNFIELYKLLQIEGLASSGGQAKLMIADGMVSVNGKVETRKRNKLRCGDQVQFENYTIRLALKSE